MTTTAFIAVFVLGPYELTYWMVMNDGPIFSTNETGTPTLAQYLFIYMNTFIIHVIFGLIVFYDLKTTYYSNRNQSNEFIIILTILYFLFYILFAEVYGQVTGIYPYTPLDPNAFDNVVFRYFNVILSPIIGFGIYCTFIWYWNEVTISNNIYQTQGYE